MVTHSPHLKQKSIRLITTDVSLSVSSLMTTGATRPIKLAIVTGPDPLLSMLSGLTTLPSLPHTAFNPLSASIGSCDPRDLKLPGATRLVLAILLRQTVPEWLCLHSVTCLVGGSYVPILALEIRGGQRWKTGDHVWRLRVGNERVRKVAWYANGVNVVRDTDALQGGGVSGRRT